METLDIIKDIRGNLPLAIQYATQVMRDRELVVRFVLRVRMDDHAHLLLRRHLR